MVCHPEVQQASSATLLSVIATGISLFSLGCSFLTIRHQRKTIQPMISDYYVISHHMDENTLAFQAYRLKNSGFGPAEINKLTFTFENKQYKDIVSLLSQHYPNIWFDHSQSFNSMREKYVIAVNEEVDLFKLCFNERQYAMSFYAFHQMLSKISLDVEFKNVYGKTKPLHREQIIKPATLQSNK